MIATAATETKAELGWSYHYYEEDYGMRPPPDAYA